MIIENDMNQLIIVNIITAVGVRALSAYYATRKRIIMKIATASTVGIHISVLIIFEFYSFEFFINYQLIYLELNKTSIYFHFLSAFKLFVCSSGSNPFS